MVLQPLLPVFLYIPWLQVLYAAGWLVGEFCEHLTSPVETLQAMLRALSSSLPPHIQVCAVKNCLESK